MRIFAVAVACFAVGATTAGAAMDVVVLPRPSFPAPAKDVEPAGARLELMSSRYHDPADPSPGLPDPPAFVPKRFRGHDLDFAIRQPGSRIFLVYGGRYLVNSFTSSSYAFDFVRFLRPPNGAYYYETVWAREVDRVLYVAHTHLTYASTTNGRNAYLSAIDIAARKTLWRSPALVANARTFVVSGDLIVSGYGFTAEPDFLYLLDRRTGRVLDRLPVPSAPERIRLRGDRLLVRTYDRDVVARIVR